MRWHVIRSLGGVRVQRIVFFHETVQPVLQVAPRGRVGVLLDREAGRGVLNQHRAQAVPNAGLAYDGLDQIGDQMQPLSGGFYRQLLDHHCLDGMQTSDRSYPLLPKRGTNRTARRNSLRICHRVSC